MATCPLLAKALLVSTLDTNLEWLREHTRLLQRATEWDGAGRAESRLLGDSIASAKAWMMHRPNADAEPTPLHFDFIRASEHAEAARPSKERRRLDEMAIAQADQASALKEKEEALERAKLARRQRAQLRNAGTVVLLSVTVFAAWEAWRADQILQLAYETTNELVSDCP